MTRPIEIHAFPDSFLLASETADHLKRSATLVDRHIFPDRESLVRVAGEPGVTAWLFCSLDNPNEKLIEVLLAADALRRNGAVRVGLVAPYLAYMRQDCTFNPGEPLSQQVIAGVLGNAFDEVLTVEAHLHRIESLTEVFPCPAQSLSATAPIAAWLDRQDLEGTVLVGPDSESEPWIRKLAEEVRRPWVIGAKQRSSDHDVSVRLPPLPQGSKRAWVIDDIASSGRTLEAVVHRLAHQDVQEVGAIIVHPIFGPAALSRLDRMGVRPIVSTNSIVHPTNAISLAAMLAEAISKRADEECS